MSVEFTDNTAKIKAALSEGVIGFLHEAGGEIQAQTQRNSRVDTGQTKGSYKYMVDEGKDESTVAVGSDLENAKNLVLVNMHCMAMEEKVVGFIRVRKTVNFTILTEKHHDNHSRKHFRV